MFSQAFIACSCAFVVLFQLAHSQDDVTLLQHSVSPQADAEVDIIAEDFEQVFADRSMEEIRAAAMQLPAAVTETVQASITEAGKRAVTDHRDALVRGWDAFYARSRSFRDPNPQQLLHNAKLALIETGAMDEMRHMAVGAANASRSLWNLVPLDSINIGYKSSFAPWNNLLQFLKLPLVKATFGLWVNFLGPYGDAARICVSASGTLDSRYGQFKTHDFSGINFWVGPASWENTPGWSFGASTGSDDHPKDPDFGWSWTVAREPEIACLFYDVCIIDSDELHANTPNATGMWLQTQSELQSEDSPVVIVPELRKRKASTHFGHTWCSPNWANTPLLLREDLKKLRANSSMSDASQPIVGLEAKEDVPGEAV